MNFKKSFIKQAIWEIRFLPALNYHNKRVEICEKIKDKLPHWRLDVRKIDMYDQLEKEESQKNFSFTSRGASLSYKDVDHYDNFKSLSIFLTENIKTGLNIKDIIRFGIRFFYLIEFEGSFTLLRNLMIKKLYKKEFLKRLEVGKNIFDLGYNIDFKKENTKYHLVLGPVAKREIKDRFGGEEYDNLKTAILFDIDCYLESVSSNIIKSFLKDSYDSSQIILKKIINGIIKGE